MAVVDVLSTANFTSQQTLAISRALFARGANIGAVLATVSVAAADDDGSIYRLFPGRDAKERPLLILIGNTAMTAATVYDLCVYEAGVGGVVDADAIFASAMDMSAAHASLNPKTALDGMAAVLPVNVGKALFEHAGHTAANARDTYDIALLADTVGSAAGTVTGLYIYALPTQ